MNAVDPWGLRDRPKFEIWHFPDSFYDDNSWLNDPNNPLAQSTDLGEIMQKSTCLAGCMAKRGAPIASESLIWDMFGVGLTASGVGSIPVSVYETLSNTGTTAAVLEALKKCLNEECSCENN